MSWLSSLTGGMSSVGNFLFGGDKGDTTSIPGMTPQEIANNQQISNVSNNLLTSASANYAAQNGAAGPQVTDFLNHLNDFIKASNQSPTPSQDQINAATNYVDQTYTNPMQNSLNQYMSNYTQAQNARAAASGVNPNSDIATQQAIAGEGQRNTINLQANRAAQIQQNAYNLNNVAYDRMGSGLNSLYQGTSYLNHLAEQSFNNQLSLLNGLSGQNNYYLAGRKPNTTETSGTSTGLFGIINGIGGEGGKIGAQISGMGQGAGALGNAGSLFGKGFNG